jgi:hypothetical protein
MLHAGKIVWRGPAAELDRTDNPYVRQFVDGRADGPISSMRSRAMAGRGTAAAILSLRAAPRSPKPRTMSARTAAPSGRSASPARASTRPSTRWYKRFWTGDCDHLNMCLPGAPNWNDIVGKLLVKGGPTERAVLLPKACRLGQLIGLEWSRDKKIRKIDTGDLHVQGPAGSLRRRPSRARKVEAAARAKLALDRLQRFRQQPPLGRPRRPRAPGDDDLAAGIGRGQRPHGDGGVVGQARLHRHRRQERHAQARADHVHQGRQGGGREALLVADALGRLQAAGGQGVVAQAVAVFQQDQVVAAEAVGIDADTAAIGWLAGAAASSSSSSTWAQSRPVMSYGRAISAASKAPAFKDAISR